MPLAVAEELSSRKDLSSLKVLDLCAGCGVVGFELAWHLPQIRSVDFVEIQEVYSEHFNDNLRIVNRPYLQTNFFLMNYENLLTPEWKNRYDLILCNPPYFVPGQGKLSPSELKNRSRFYLDSSFSRLIEVIMWTLKADGEAYLLLRSLQDHALNLENQIQEVLKGRGLHQKVGDIRGTDLLRIRPAFF